jgi:hypothetical protein
LVRVTPEAKVAAPLALSEASVVAPEDNVERVVVPEALRGPDTVTFANTTPPATESEFPAALESVVMPATDSGPEIVTFDNEEPPATERAVPTALLAVT